MTVTRWVGKHTYELELTERLKHIHPVISIAHLEQATKDPYNWHIEPPGPIIVNDEEHYTLDRITGKERWEKESFYRVK